MSQKKKAAATVGTVLHKIKDASHLKTWADFLAAESIYQSAGISAEQLVSFWSGPQMQFYSALEPRDAKRNPGAPSFDIQNGLIVFTAVPASEVLATHVKASGAPALEQGGLMLFLTAKAGYKNSAKNLLSAAERVMAEAHSTFYALAFEKDGSTQRALKAQGYEEVARLSDFVAPGVVGVLFKK